MSEDVGQDERLAARTVGTEGPRVVFVHGLFGQGKNWTTIAKALADGHRVTLLDLPNHGHSPCTDTVDYEDMAELVAAQLESYGEPVTLVGHSMGGKVAMTLALRRPELVRALAVVDIAPVEYPVSGGRTEDPDEEASPFADYIAAMKALDLSTLERREEADEALQAAVPAGWCAASCCRAWSGKGWGPAPAGGGGSTSTCWSATSSGCAASRLLRRAPTSTGPCSGSPARTRTTCCRRTACTWTRCSPRPASCGSRTPVTGCTPSSPRSSPRPSAGFCSTSRKRETRRHAPARVTVRRGSHRQRLPGSCSGKLWTAPAPVDDATGIFGPSCFSRPRRQEPA